MAIILKKKIGPVQLSAVGGALISGKVILKKATNALQSAVAAEQGRVEVMGVLDEAGLNLETDSVTVPGDMTQRQKDALEATGLGPAPTKSKLVIKRGGKYSPLETGTRVRVINDLFTWIMAYKFGDTGTLEKVHKAPSSVHTTPLRDDMYLLRLDNPTTNPVVIVKRWEIEELKEELTA